MNTTKQQDKYIAQCNAPIHKQTFINDTIDNAIQELESIRKDVYYNNFDFDKSGQILNRPTEYLDSESFESIWKIKKEIDRAIVKLQKFK